MINSVNSVNINNYSAKVNNKDKDVCVASSLNNSVSGMLDIPENYGRNLVSFKSLNSTVPKDLKTVFEALENKSGEDFAQSAYKELVKYFGLSDVAPKKLTIKETSGVQNVADYIWHENQIVVYKDLFDKQSKVNQLGFIAHELTHLKQTTNILRTEGLPIQNYAFAIAISDFKACLIKNPVIKRQYSIALSMGKEKEYAKMIITKMTKRTYNELVTVFVDVLKLPKHPLNSPKGQKAVRDVKAQFEYNGVDPKAYSECPTEKEAMMVERSIVKMYATYNKQK